MSKELTLPELEKLLGSKELTLFYLSWLKHNRNATRAYKELHPHVTDRSASTLGSAQLANIDIKVIAQAYGLDHMAYMEQLAKGLIATKRDQFSGEMSEDHRVRAIYHDKLGNILGIEGPQSQINVQVNIPTFNVMSDEAKDQLEKLYERPNSTND